MFGHRKRSAKEGLPPGTAVHVGSRIVDAPIVRRIVFGEGGATITEGAEARVSGAGAETETVWLRVVGLHEVARVEALCADFGVHVLAIEDILNTAQRPKAEAFPDHLFVVVKAFEFQDGELVEDQISLIVGERFILSFEEGACPTALDRIQERVRLGRGVIRRMGSGYLTFSLLDSIVDRYFSVVEEIGERLEVLEDEVLAEPQKEALVAIQAWKRELIRLRRFVWPVRDVANHLLHAQDRVFGGDLQVYLRDLYGHVVQVIESLEIYREMLSGMLEIYLSSISNRTNDVMKVLTMFAAIFIPLTFIVGVYGMNFDYMPELHARWGYAGVWVFMLVSAGAIAVYFRRKNWY